MDQTGEKLCTAICKLEQPEATTSFSPEKTTWHPRAAIWSTEAAAMIGSTDKVMLMDTHCPAAMATIGSGEVTKVIQSTVII